MKEILQKLSNLFNLGKENRLVNQGGDVPSDDVETGVDAAQETSKEPEGVESGDEAREAAARLAGQGKEVLKKVEAAKESTEWGQKYKESYTQAYENMPDVTFGRFDKVLAKYEDPDTGKAYQHIRLTPAVDAESQEVVKDAMLKLQNTYLENIRMTDEGGEEANLPALRVDRIARFVKEFNKVLVRLPKEQVATIIRQLMALNSVKNNIQGEDLTTTDTLQTEFERDFIRPYMNEITAAMRTIKNPKKCSARIAELTQNPANITNPLHEVTFAEKMNIESQLADLKKDYELYESISEEEYNRKKATLNAELAKYRPLNG